MENVIATLANASIQRVRFTKLSAERLGKGSLAKGRLSITTGIDSKASKEKLESGRHGSISVISVRVLGIPEEAAGVTDRNEELHASFKIEVRVEAFLEWTAQPPDELLTDADSEIELARPIYLLAVSEVRALGLKLGLSGFSLAMDLKTAIKKSQPYKPARKMPTKRARTKTPEGSAT